MFRDLNVINGRNGSITGTGRRDAASASWLTFALTSVWGVVNSSIPVSERCPLALSTPCPSDPLGELAATSACWATTFDTATAPSRNLKIERELSLLLASVGSRPEINLTSRYGTARENSTLGIPFM